MKLDVQGVSWRVAGARIVHEVSLQCAPGSFVGLIGPNGSGKTTLLRCINRVLQPHAGSIELDSADVWRLSAREAAQRIAVVLPDSGERYVSTPFFAPDP